MVCLESDAVFHLADPFPAVPSLNLQDRANGLQQALGTRDGRSPPAPLPRPRQEGHRKTPRGWRVVGPAEVSELMDVPLITH